MLKKIVAAALVSMYAVAGMGSAGAFNPTHVEKESTAKEIFVEVAKFTTDSVVTLGEKAVNLGQEVVGVFSIDSAEASSNPLVNMADSTASGSIIGAQDIMSSDIGYIIYFVIGLAIVSLVIGAVLYWVNKGRGQ